ncbi:MAG: NAD-dependent epimerase/dehydratase family protein [Thermodesulfovibrionia bacterium]|nr:NAD-dependent epimerase/dehydratase family protein [Thermodesulfovibrionia bacterium]
MGNYLITGGAGFIGSKVAEALLARGDSVSIIDNISTGYESSIPEKAVFIKSDCQDAGVYRGLSGEKFDAILHIAGQSSGEVSFDDPVYDLRSNTESTLHLLKFAFNSGCRRFIYASTMSVYGQPEMTRVNENSVCAPISFYAVGKLASENYLRIYEKYGMLSTSLRLFNVYGPGQNLENMRQGMVSIYLAQMIKKDRIIVKGSLERFRDFIYIDDVVRSFLLCLDLPQTVGKTLNVGTGIKTTVRDLLKIMLEIYSKDVPIVQDGSTMGDINGITADIDQFRNVAGFVPEIQLKEGLHRMIQWALQTR